MGIHRFFNCSKFIYLGSVKSRDFCKMITRKTIYKHSAINDLSRREFQVLRLISKELNTREIADKLFISYETVKSHRKSLFAKMKARNVAGLIRRSYEYGVLVIPKEEWISNTYLNSNGASVFVSGK